MNKTVLIIGSNSDVGQATAYVFAQKGFDVQLASRNLNEYQHKLAKDITIKHEVKADCVFFDGNKLDTHSAFVQNLVPFPDVVVSVFGYLGDQKKAENSIQETVEIINANYTGHVTVLNSIAQIMEENKQGTIIGVSSVAGERGRQSNYIYGSAKAGFTAYLSGLRNRMCQHNVHVATVIPGFINTKMTEGIPTPKPLTAEAKQVAEAIYKAYYKQKNVVYSLFMWRYIMLIIRNIPEFIFKKMKM